MPRSDDGDDDGDDDDDDVGAFVYHTVTPRE